MLLRPRVRPPSHGCDLSYVASGRLTRVSECRRHEVLGNRCRAAADPIRMECMDQGWAALAGAGVGVAGTLCTSWLTYAAARRQARDQGAVEHGRALRNERLEAYLAFMKAAEPVDSVLHRVAHQDGARASARNAPPPADVLHAAVEELGTAVDALYKAQARLDLMGPKPVAAQAVNVWSDVRSLRTYLERVRLGMIEGGVPHDEYRTGLEDVVDAVEVSRERFARRAREVIETPP
ncbi:conserved hypothetical protein [Streptomyces sp. e14]|nr:conserved hypothetical protein [Streptomyces sp. e14]